MKCSLPELRDETLQGLRWNKGWDDFQFSLALHNWRVRETNRFRVMKRWPRSFSRFAKWFFRENGMHDWSSLTCCRGATKWLGRKRNLGNQISLRENVFWRERGRRGKGQKVTHYFWRGRNPNWICAPVSFPNFSRIYVFSHYFFFSMKLVDKVITPRLRVVIRISLYKDRDRWKAIIHKSCLRSEKVAIPRRPIRESVCAHDFVNWIDCLITPFLSAPSSR